MDGPCPDEVRLLMYLEGALSAGEEAEMKRHLEGCVTCRGWVAATREVGRRIALEGRTGTPAGQHTAGDCPDEAVVAAFVDGVLGEAKAVDFRRHLLSCASCRARVADLVRDLAAAGEGEPVPLPDWVRQKARSLVGGAAGGDLSSRPALTVLSGERSAAGRAGGSGGRRIWSTWMGRGALAAAAALALVLGLRLLPGPVAPGPASRGPVMREVSDGHAAFQVTAPRDGAEVRVAPGTPLTLAWSPSGLGHVIGYRVTVRDPGGNEVWTGDVAVPGVAVPASAGLKPGCTYTWWVTARTEFGTREETRSATFSVLP